MNDAPTYRDRIVNTGAGHAPPRRPGSVRRTTSIDTYWPGGMLTPSVMTGRARDYFTPAEDGSGRTLVEETMVLKASPMREILALETDPPRPNAAKLIGTRAGGHSRAALSDHMPEDKAAGTPLHLLLDDFAGASLVSGWVWSRWHPDWMSEVRKHMKSTAGKAGKMVGICSGFRPGSTALEEDGTARQSVQSHAAVLPLENPDDPEGWHEMIVPDKIAARRARRIDVWLEGDLIRIETAFQDSGTTPEGGRVAIHEYLARASADLETLTLQSLEVEPLILPFQECPNASHNAPALVGSTLTGLRKTVLDMFTGPPGCTHLNDVLRNMADAGILAEKLRAEL